MRDAYDIQDQYVALLRAANGDPVGYKVGLTSKTMQTFCGIDHPIGGVVLAKRVHQSGATVRRGDYGRLGLEFEIAVRIKSDIPASAQNPLPSRHISMAFARRSKSSTIAPRTTAISMFARWSPTIPGMPALCCPILAQWPDLERMLGKATQNGAPIGEGYGRDILGHPFNSVAWLNAQLASRGGGLRKAPGRDDRQRDEDGVSDGAGGFPVRVRRAWGGEVKVA